MLPDTEEFLIAAFGRGYRKANRAKARHLLDANPELAKASVFDAAAAGDLGALSGFIQAGPRAAVNPGRNQEWASFGLRGIFHFGEPSLCGNAA